MPTCPECRESFDDAHTACPKDGTALLPDQSFASLDLPLPEGTKAGDYRIEGVIGDGGFGTVYRGHHPVIGKSVAIKVLKREYSANPEMVSRFISEARAVNQIRHKNIIDIFGFGVLLDGRNYYVMELLEGTTLDRLIRTRGRLTPEEAIPILKQLSRALGAAHAVGITHRDLKPENVFLTFDEDGEPIPKLLDFGIAKLLGVDQAQHKTRSGTPMGTPLYMSPEQVHGKAIDHRTDIYSFGILVHELFTGAPPFDGDSVMEVLTMQTTATAPPMSSLVSSIPTDLDRPVLEMMRKDPKLRPASITHAMEMLQQAAETSGVTTRPSSNRGRTLLSAGTQAAEGPVRSSGRAQQVGHRTSTATTLVAEEGSKAQSDSLEPTESPELRVSQLGSPVRRWVLFGVAACAVAAGAAYVLAIATSTTTPSAAAGSVIGDTTSTSSANVAPEVTITVEAEVRDAEVYLGARRLAKVGEGIRLPQSTDRVMLTLKHASHAPRDFWVTPSRDLTITTDFIDTKTASSAVKATGEPVKSGGKTGGPVKAAGDPKPVGPNKNELDF